MYIDTYRSRFLFTRAFLGALDLLGPFFLSEVSVSYVGGAIWTPTPLGRFVPSGCDLRSVQETLAQWATIDGFTSVFHSTSSYTITFSRTGQVNFVVPKGHQCMHNGLCPLGQVAGVLFAREGATALLAAMRLKVFPPRPTLLISGPLRCES